jgi:hypothetical protein
MADSAGFERAKDLVLRAQEAGFDVSAEQIARWNRLGLLLKPHQHGLGQGNGSEVLYPIGTGDQLIALLTIHRQFRKLEAVAWYLWLNGFSVAERYWRKPLGSAAIWFDERRRLFKTKIFDVAGHIVSFRRGVEGQFHNLANARIENRHFRRARRRVGTDQIAEVARTLLTIAIGEYRPDAEPSDITRIAEQKYTERVLGLAQARIDRLPNGQPLLTGRIEPVLEQLSERLSKITKAMMLQQIANGNIEVARDEFRFLLTGLQYTYQHHEKVLGKDAFGLGVITELGRITDIRSQAILILLFQTAIRYDSQNMVRLREIYRGIDGIGVTHGRHVNL